MSIKNNFGWYENITIDVRDSNGNLLDTTQFHNKLTDIGLNWVANSLRTSSQDSEIKYLAWGSDSTAVSSTHTTLKVETGRKLITSQTSSGTGVCETICWLGPTDAVGTIEEIGWFCGSSANSTSNSGCMISRVLYSRAKTSLENITITRTDTFSE